MKRLFYILFSFLFSLFIIISPLNTLASDGYSEVEIDVEIAEKNESAETSVEVLSLNAPSCILMDERNRQMKVNFKGFDFVEGGLCAPAGFKAAGIHCGIRKNKTKRDLALIYSDTICNAAAIYTQNKVKGAPIAVTKRNIKN